MKRSVVAALAAIALYAMPAAADAVGRATVVDGDTLDIRGERIRLHGIDAPESSQVCDAQVKPSRCGQQASLALADLVGSKTVRCEERCRDRYGPHGRCVCALGGVDVEAWMVRHGWALAYKYSRDYVRDEEGARAAGVGMWRGYSRPWRNLGQATLPEV